MIQKQKTWIWKLTGPFAAGNFTTIGETIYYPKKHGPAMGSILNHEAIHIAQQKQVGVAKFVFLYLFALPLFFNPWRWRWEWEAFEKGSKYDAKVIRRVLRSTAYGWLKHRG